MCAKMQISDIVGMCMRWGMDAQDATRTHSGSLCGGEGESSCIFLFPFSSRRVLRPVVLVWSIAC